MKLALVGTGMIVKEVLPVLKEIKSIDLMAIVSTPRSLEIAEALADAFGIQQASCQLAEVLKMKRWIRFMLPPQIICILKWLSKPLRLVSMSFVKSHLP